jgi:hypothetical protein
MFFNVRRKSLMPNLLDMTEWEVKDDGRWSAPLSAQTQRERNMRERAREMEAD